MPFKRECELTGNQIKFMIAHYSQDEIKKKADCSYTTLWRYQLHGNSRPTMLSYVAKNLEGLWKKKKFQQKWEQREVKGNGKRNGKK